MAHAQFWKPFSYAWIKACKKACKKDMDAACLALGFGGCCLLPIIRVTGSALPSVFSSAIYSH